MIFLTGCNGLVGSFVARRLLSENYYVRALRRKQSDLSLIKDIESKIEWIEGDILDISLLEGALKGVDTIIHSAAIVSFNPSDKKRMFQANVEGTTNLVNAALLQEKPPLFVQVSSVAALGRRKNLSIIDENIYWENSSYNSNYAVSKYYSELEVWRGMEEGLRTIIVNPSIVFGPGNWNSGSTRIFKYGWNENYFYPTGEMNFVDVRDVAEIIAQLITHEKAIGERFILNGATLSYEKIFKTIAKHFAKKSPSIRANVFLSEIAWRAEALKSFIARTEPAITKETARASKQTFSYNNSKIKKILNYNFTESEDTIKWVCGELRKNYNV